MRISNSPINSSFILNSLIQLLVITLGMTTIASADNTVLAYEFSISPSDTHFTDYVCSFDCGSEEHDESDTIEIRALNKDILELTIRNTGNPHLGTLIVRHYDNAGNLDGEITVNANKDRTMQLRFWNNLPDMLEISTTDSAFGDGVQYELEFNWDTTQRNQDWDQWIDDEDDCPTVSGESYRGFLGCPDKDEDGWADTHDAFPDDNSQWSDQDGDGFGDNSEGTKSDACPEEYGTSTLPILGCIDTDEDGWADTYDAFPDDNSQWSDQDGDGFGDNSEGTNGDGCPEEYGTSKFLILGCVDTDGDGWADTYDAFPNDDKDWIDSDKDGIGDNSDVFPEDSSEWVDTDLDGVGDNSDVFPEDSSEWIDTDLDGVGDNADVFPENASETVDSDGDGFGDNIDRCPFEYGINSTLQLGCPNLDLNKQDNVDEHSDNLSESLDGMFSQDSEFNVHIDSITDLDTEGNSDLNQITSQNTSTPFRLSMVLFGAIPMLVGILAFVSGRNSGRNRFNVRFEEMEENIHNAIQNARELEQSLQDSEIQKRRMEIWIDEAKRDLATENIIPRAENYLQRISDQNTKYKDELEQSQQSLHITRMEKERLDREIEAEKRAQQRELQAEKRAQKRILEDLKNERNEISEEIERMKNTGELVGNLRGLRDIIEQWKDPEIPAEIERLVNNPLWDDIEI